MIKKEKQLNKSDVALGDVKYNPVFHLSSKWRINSMYTVEELVHVALKAKVTSHYDLGVKVFIYTLPA